MDWRVSDRVCGCFIQHNNAEFWTHFLLLIHRQTAVFLNQFFNVLNKLFDHYRRSPAPFFIMNAYCNISPPFRHLFTRHDASSKQFTMNKRTFLFFFFLTIMILWADEASHFAGFGKSAFKWTRSFHDYASAIITEKTYENNYKHDYDAANQGINLFYHSFPSLRSHLVSRSVS